MRPSHVAAPGAIRRDSIGPWRSRSDADQRARRGRRITSARRHAQRWPDARCHVVLNRNIPASARALLAPTFGVTWLDTSPTEDERGVASALDECQADLVFFDNSGTGRQCRHAKRLGARTVFLSTRDRTLARGFGLDWLPWLDEHWIVGPRALAAPLSPWRRVTAAMSGTAVRSLQSVFTTTDAPRAAQLRHALGCPDGRYVCVVPGGGGGLIDGTAAAVIFADAAARVARRAGVPCVLLLGPLYEGADLTRPGVVVHLASHVQTVDLIAGAHVVVLGPAAASSRRWRSERCASPPVPADTSSCRAPARGRRRASSRPPIRRPTRSPTSPAPCSPTTRVGPRCSAASTRWRSRTICPGPCRRSPACSRRAPERLPARQANAIRGRGVGFGDEIMATVAARRLKLAAQN